MRFNANTLDRLKLELEAAFDGLNNPGEPSGVFHCATADLPDPAKYVGRWLRDTTTNTFKYSDGSTWS